MCVKNDKVNLNIIDLTNEGLGVAKKDGKVFFVKDALPLDEVNAVVTKVNKNIIYARSIEILNPSPFRVDPRCSISNACGGCQIASLDYNKQLEIKKEFTLNNLKNIAKQDVRSKYEEIIGMDEPYNFRNKMQVPFSRSEGDITFGFYASRTHHVIPFNTCCAGFTKADIVLFAIKRALIKYNISIYNEESGFGIFREALLRCGNESKEISITYIINDDKVSNSNLDLYREFDECIRNELNSLNIVTTTLNINIGKNNVLLGKENISLYGKGYIEDSIGHCKYKISPTSFYQINNKLTKVLYDKILSYGSFNGSENVLDLFCGIGTISLYIASKVKSVTGIEIIKDAVENAKENSLLNNITNAKFILADVNNNLDEIINIYLNEKKFDCIIVDPPRKGLSKESINTILKLGPSKIIYVSCDSATLSRDLDILCDSNNRFRIERLCNIDMFPHTTHVETVCLLSQRKPDTTIEVDLDISELEVSSAETKATYEEIKSYVLEKYGLKVSNLYIAQVKRECGIVERINYNLPKTEGNRVPQCPEDKRKAIKDAFVHFQMI